ncbi:MAG: hypothetical protein JNL83_24885 [Myxococcales bacterium]|nr:hypothetical protein [Myxococcales bacterium]
MRHLLVLALAVITPACKKKNDSSSVPLGSSGLALAVPGDDSVTVTEAKPGYWDVRPGGNGSTTVEVKYTRGMPTRTSLESLVREDTVIGAIGRVEDGPNGMLIYSVTRPNDDDRSKSQNFVYAYLPTTDGAALCQGWSPQSSADAHLTVCRTLMVAR